MSPHLWYIQNLALIGTVVSVLAAGGSMALIWGMLQGKMGGSLWYHRLRPDRWLLFFFILAGIIYLGYKIAILSALSLSPFAILAALTLLVSELFTLITCTHSVFDVLIAINHPDTAIPGLPTLKSLPFVSLHVPVCREPPELVFETLEALRRLDYPEYEVIVISNNTSDACQWQPVKARCEQIGFRFYHFDTLKGYKAGALNAALSLASPQSELIGIVDADNVSAPDFLLRAVGAFEDERVAFVQTRQDYRRWKDRSFWRGIYPLYMYFYDIVMVARQVRGSLVFCGSMGLIRTKLLKEIGGWDEWCITEDAEASLRLLRKGYQGVYINESFGYGILPPSFGDMKRQWFRWMAGAAQIIRKHRLYHLLSKKNNDLSFIQKWDYLLGGSMSFGSLLMVSSILFLSTAVVLMLFLPQKYLMIFTSLSVSVAIFSFFILITGMSSLLAFKVKMGFPWREASYAFFALLALGYTRGFAFLRAFTQQSIPFRRTAKLASRSGVVAAISGVKEELIAAALALALGGMVWLISPPQLYPYGLAIMLLWQLISYFSAILISVQSN